MMIKSKELINQITDKNPFVRITVHSTINATSFLLVTLFHLKFVLLLLLEKKFWTHDQTHCIHVCIFIYTQIHSNIKITKLKK